MNFKKWNLANFEMVSLDDFSIILWPNKIWKINPKDVVNLLCIIHKHVL